jgi:epoxyqueuosine reductase
MPQKEKVNYQKQLDELIGGFNGKVPSLLLHACCAPCSSYVLEYLSTHFKITIFYYNPNISPEEEYQKRVAEVKRLIAELPAKHEIHFQEGKYDTASFFALAKGHEQEPEGGERCFACYALRLNEAAQIAKAGGFDYFTTTLSISPYKNAEKLNEIGRELGEKYGIDYLPSDFKKKNGYRRSIELSKEYNLYRQDYCGCVFSKAQRDRWDALQKQGAQQSE